MSDAIKIRMVSSLLRRAIGTRHPQGVNRLLGELSSQMYTVGLGQIMADAFVQACRMTEMIGDAPVILANRLTVSSILNTCCRAAGVNEPHIDAASIELMVNGGKVDVADDDARDTV